MESSEKGRAPKESIFSYGKDTSLDKLNMAGLPLRTSTPQPAQSERQEREGPQGQVSALREGVPAFADLVTPSHKVSRTLGQQSTESQLLRNSHNPSRREKQIGA